MLMQNVSFWVMTPPIGFVLYVSRSLLGMRSMISFEFLLVENGFANAVDIYASGFGPPLASYRHTEQ